MLRICLAFWKSEPLYAYICYAYKKYVCTRLQDVLLCVLSCSNLVRGLCMWAIVELKKYVLLTEDHHAFRIKKRHFHFGLEL